MKLNELYFWTSTIKNRFNLLENDLYKKLLIKTWNQVEMNYLEAEPSRYQVEFFVSDPEGRGI